MGFVNYEAQGAVGLVTINRPEALNALNPQVLADLKAVFEGIDQNAIRCVVVTGAGEKSFVAGADIGSMSVMTKAEGEAFGKMGNDVFRMIETFPIPVIAAVNGFALGGGNELAMCCDFRICSDNAMFGQPEVGLGITPGFSGTQRLPRRVGIAKAKELIFSGKVIGAAEAEKIGLVNAVYAPYTPEALMDGALEMGKSFTKNAPIAVKYSKACIDRGMQMDIDDGIALENELFAMCFATADQKEGMSAFVEKRKEKHFQNK